MSRTTDRNGFTPDQRIVLAEQDLDRNDAAVDRLAATVASEIASLRRQLSRYTGALVGAVISFSTAAIILAWQIAGHR